MMLRDARRVFVDVDTQVDFMQPTGRLAITGAEAIIANLRTLTEYAQRHAIPIIASACAHAEDDPEFAQFPPHCVRGTPGQRRIPETDHAQAAVLGVEFDAEAARKFERAGVAVLEKVQFDLFSNPNADALIGAVPDAEFVVYGVATDYCVRAAVLGLVKRGRAVTVVEDAIRPVDARDGARAVEEFRAIGVPLATTRQVCDAR